VSRPSYLQIDLSAVQSNLALVKSLAPNSKTIACVKANAYGHGAIEVSRAIENSNRSSADLLGLASLEEAQELSAAGISTPKLLLEGCFDKGELTEASQANYAIVVHCEKQVLEILQSELPNPLSVWLKLDSGMHRLGFDPSQYRKAFQRLEDSGKCSSINLMSHFACSEELDNPFNDQQISVFSETTATLQGARSIANSAAILTRPETHLDWVRPGYMLYGNSPMPGEMPEVRNLRPAMSFYSEVISIRHIKAGEGVGYNHAWRAEKDSTIAVVAVGYGDGYPRNAKNGSPVLVDGQPAGTVGHIAMDMMLVDVTRMPNAQPGSKVELWGKELPVSQVAEHSGMSGYELLTRLTARLPRHYLT